ncbi:class II aldolase/adducin family protein [Parahaliea sp. F7430]|uniref:Class II aldolase/adducin family protein n=1 Tax=Sediminihaliea albiluteola TaxID=2758564 RepID=A0A7W2YJI4_9GAMM|nr:class II aldolase/adducin family protein [Sediminihaliea albiluteola]MBA6413150.1 class II aldolase/adducin family protein [Sediminihaliea albiluteola]
MSKYMGLDQAMMERYAPRPGRKALLPELSEQAKVALMCRMLFREGWNEHIAGHITYRLANGNILTNPWELAWDELTASDIVTLDHQGNVIEGEWNVTPAIGLHIQLHALRPDTNVVIHNHAHWSGIWANMQRVPPVYDQTGAHCGVDLPLYDEYAGTFENEATSLSAAEALGDSKWALLANHGALVVGKDLRQAHLRVITLEWRCKRAYEVELAGGGVPLDDAVVEKIGITDANGFPFCWEAMARRELRADPSIIE